MSLVAAGLFCSVREAPGALDATKRRRLGRAHATEIGCLLPIRLCRWPNGGRSTAGAIRAHKARLLRKENEIAPAQLDIDRKIEHGEIADSPLMLKSGSQRPDMLWLQRRLRSDDATEVPRITRLLAPRLDIHGRSPSWDAASWKILSNADVLLRLVVKNATRSAACAISGISPRAPKADTGGSTIGLQPNFGARYEASHP